MQLEFWSNMAGLDLISSSPIGMFLLVLLLLPSVLVANDAAENSYWQLGGSIDRGKSRCPCIATESIYEEYPNRRCTHNKHKNGTTEIQGTLFNEGVDCYPLNYGSTQCLQWDTVVGAPSCEVEDPPRWCRESWCYIDREICHSSNVTHYKSKSIYDGLYWSYATCGGDASSWLNHDTTRITESKTLDACLANIWYPPYYKMDQHSNVVENGSPAVYDQSLPWQGVLIDYFNDLLEISNMKKAQYRHRSGGSAHKEIVSKATQAISDVGAGLADVAIGTFWVTAERLEIAPFTVPIITDTFKLWVPGSQAAVKTSMADNLNRLRQPFSDELWIVLIFAILANAILSGILCPLKFRKYDRNANHSILERIKRVMLIMTDSLNLSCLEFLGGGLETAPAVEQNIPQKMLNIGFAVVVFVTVTAYTANLAAFLTISGGATMISSIEEATESGMVVCANYNLRNELRALHPKTNFLFGPDNKNVQELYEQEKCGAIVMGLIDIRIDPDAQTWYCQNQLARVGPAIIEFPVAFPSTPELVGGLSHWVAEAKKQGVDFENYLERVPSSCSLEVGVSEINEIALMTQQFTLENMLLPLIVFVVAACGAVSIHLFKIVYYRKGNEEKSGRNLIRKSLGWSGKLNISKHARQQISTQANKEIDIAGGASGSNEYSTTDYRSGSLSFNKIEQSPPSPQAAIPTRTGTPLENLEGLHLRGLSRRAERGYNNRENYLLEQFLVRQRQLETMEEQRHQAMKDLEEFLRNSLIESSMDVEDYRDEEDLHSVTRI